MLSTTEIRYIYFFMYRFFCIVTNGLLKKLAGDPTFVRCPKIVQGNTVYVCSPPSTKNFSLFHFFQNLIWYFTKLVIVILSKGFFLNKQNFDMFFFSSFNVCFEINEGLYSLRERLVEMLGYKLFFCIFFK